MRKIIYLIVLCLLLPVSCFAGTIPPGSPAGPSTPGRPLINTCEAAVGAPGVYFAVSYGLLNDATIASLVSRIASNPANIVLTAGTWTISNNLTIPSNISLLFMQGAVLNIASGKIVTINGPLGAEAYQIFAGNGTVNFMNNRSIEKYNLTWWGPPDDYSADAQPAIQAAINAVPDNSTLYAPSGQKYLVNSTITISIRKNLQFITTPPNMNSGYTTIKWNGAAGGTVINLDRAYWCTVSGWTILATNADAGIVSDGYSSGHIGSANIIADNNIYNSTTNGNFRAISISPTATDNQEFMKIRRNTLSCKSDAGTGLYFGASSNAHGHILDSNIYDGCAIGLHALNAGFRMEGINDFWNNGIDIQIEDMNYPVIISFADSEGSGQFINLLSSSNAPTTIDHCRIASAGAANTGQIAFGSTARNVRFTDNLVVPATAWVFDFANASGNLNLYLSNNRYMPGGGPVFGNFNINNGYTVTQISDRVPSASANYSINQLGQNQVNHFDGIIEQTLGPTLRINGNAVTISNSIHHIGGPPPLLLKNIYSSPTLRSGSVLFIPDQPFTTDTAGNIGRASTAVVGKMLIMVYDGTKWWPSY